MAMEVVIDGNSLTLEQVTAVAAARARVSVAPWAKTRAGAARKVVDRLVEHFGTLQKLLSAGVEDLQVVEGVGELRARSVREGLSRLAESTILERYV